MPIFARRISRFHNILWFRKRDAFEFTFSTTPSPSPRPSFPARRSFPVRKTPFPAPFADFKRKNKVGTFRPEVKR
jgi:hypothetical protein